MADLLIRDPHQSGSAAFTAVDGVDIAVGNGEFRLPARALRVRKDDHVAHDSGPRNADGRSHRDRRAQRHLPPPPRHRNVGMVFQDYGLYTHMTVFGNIAYPLKVRRMSREVIAQKVRAVAETMRIVDVLDRMPDQLAAGQLQRVAIARMLVRDADVFLMDEPMSHLDAQLPPPPPRGHMRAELRHIQKEIGTTTIFRHPHDQLEAMTMADRIIVMNAGKMLQFATPLEIFERPADEFVATFVGEPQMNVMDATLRLGGGGLVAPISDRSPFRSMRIGREPTTSATRRARRCGSASVPNMSGSRRRLTLSTPLVSNSILFEPTGPENIFVLRAGDVELTTRNFDRRDGGSGQGRTLADGHRLRSEMDISLRH